jgi:uncharacterized protein (TIGR01319 family)
VCNTSHPPNQAEVLVADIGSTLTKLSAFGGLGNTNGSGTRHTPCFLGQGMALTTVAAGNVMLGLDKARQELEATCGVETSGASLMATSSAAGGLRMTVHGLTRDMTLRAAREASLGAGAIVIFTTAGRISMDNLEEIHRQNPRLILLAGGVDYGDRDVVVANARALATLRLAVPVIYAGNRAARGEVQRILHNAQVPVFVVENVYPRIDELHLEPVRQVIQDVFARHIVTALGIEQVKALVTGNVMPTPGAVMRPTELLADVLGDVLTIDVGGATTDVHSVTAGSPAYVKLMVAPEPRSKRTVEGDLGVYINAAHIVAAAGEAQLELQDLKPLPDSALAHQRAVTLTRWAVDIAVWRHAGEVRAVYGAYGRNELVEGRDLTAIKYVIGTGGALTRLGIGREILGHIKADPRQRKLLPPHDARVLLDQHYIMAAAGVLSQYYPEAATALLLDSLGLPCEEAYNGRTIHHNRP